jgi:hypothetical protein
MTNHEASRTLVKSAPELWAECSDAKSLAKHLGAFGEIRITRLEPETTVAWEGDAASGTVRLEPSGWGTRVVLTATSEADGAEPEPPEPAPATEVVAVAQAPEPTVAVGHETEAPVATEDVEEEAPAGRFARFREWLGRDRRRQPKRSPAGAEEVPEAVAAADPDELVPVGPADAVTPAESDTRASDADEPAPVGADEPAPTAGALDAALDSLGRAHHRPYSRA